jgi:hypothetical protein
MNILRNYGLVISQNTESRFIWLLDRKICINNHRNHAAQMKSVFTVRVDFVPVWHESIWWSGGIVVLTLNFGSRWE